jgi:repressor LexA
LNKSDPHIDVMVLGQRIKSEREHQELTQQYIADKIGVVSSTIQRYETGNIKKVKIPVINAIASALNVNPSWLLALNVDKHIDNNKLGHKIPVLGKVQAGIPIEAVHDVLDEEEIEPDMALSGEYFALKIKGSSMEPRIYDGDVVIVRRQPDVESGQIAVILIDGKDATVKIVEKHEDGIVLIGLNPSVYPPHLYTNKQIEELPITILGKVVELRGKFE